MTAREKAREMQFWNLHDAKITVSSWNSIHRSARVANALEVFNASAINVKGYTGATLCAD